MTDGINKFIICEMNGIYLGIDFKYIKETAILNNYLNTAFLHPELLGLTNIKGEIIPILDPFACTSKSMADILIIIFARELTFSLICNEIIDIILLSKDKTLYINNKEFDYISQYFKHEQKCVHLLDIERYLKFLDKNLSIYCSRNKEGS